MNQDQDQQEHEAATLFASLPPEGQRHALRVLRHMSNRDEWTGSFGWLIGIHYVEREPGHIICRIDVDESHHNPAGVAHGGVVYSLIDSAMGGTVHSYLEPGQRCVTAELKVNYLRPVRTGQVTAVATLVQRGRTLAVVTAEVHNAQNELVAIGLGTFAIIQRR